MRILILQAGFNEIGVIRELKAMGAYVIAIGNRKGLYGQEYADEYHCLDYSKVDEVIQFVLDNKIDRVCACCNDTAVLTAVKVAEVLGQKCYDTYKNSVTIAHKNIFKDFAMKNGVMTVNSHAFNDIELAKKYVHNILEYPIIIKPVDLSGGKCVSRADTIEEANEAIQVAIEMSRSKEIVIEPFLEGSQHGFCTFLKNKKVVACCSNDEISVVNPYRVEIDMFPATGIEKDRDVLIGQVEKIAELLQLEDGIFHMQYIKSGGKIFILEVMRRIIGNMYSIPAKQIIDFNWDYWQARVHSGMDCEEVPSKLIESGYYAYRALIPPTNGRIKSIYIDENIRPYIFEEKIFYKKGHLVENYTAETAGLIFLKFASEEEMKTVMLEQYNNMKVVME